jgi:integrase/recombinase XerD
MNKLLSIPARRNLRQRMIEDMSVRGFSAKTQHDYQRIVSRFAAFLGRSPDSATAEVVRRFQVEQREAGMPAPAMNSHVAALRFFFTTMIDRPDLSRKLIRVSYPRKLPTVLSPDEVARLLGAKTCIKHRAALSVAYGAGLRVTEVAALKIGNVDSERMLIRVERGKGGRHRNAMLSPDLLTLLRTWWLEGRRQGAMFPGGWLFPGQNPVKPISTRQLARADGSVGQPRTIDQGHGGAAGHRGDGQQGQEDARRARAGAQQRGRKQRTEDRAEPADGHGDSHTGAPHRHPVVAGRHPVERQGRGADEEADGEAREGGGQEA